MNTSYTVTEKIRNAITTSDKLRFRILTTPLNAKTERELKWYFKIEKIKWAMAVSGTALSDFEIDKILQTPYPKKPNPIEREIFALKNVFEYLQEDWTAMPTAISMNAVKKIYEIGCKPYLGRMTGITDISETMVKESLNFLNQGKEHPIILAGIAHIEFMSARLLENGNSSVARLLSYLMLYKSGYDIRGMYAIDSFHKLDLATYNGFMDRLTVNPGITGWLEYYTQGIAQTLEKSLDTINKSSSSPKNSQSLVKLNSRQKEILSKLEKPGTKITNKDYQKIFSVSQITASRDLTKLTNLGFLLTQGRGRSIFYTKV